MNKVVMGKRPRLQTLTYRLNSGQSRWQHTDSMAFRDRIELHNRKYIMKRHNFFSKQDSISNGHGIPHENLLTYDPILTQCIARWLWLNYKITDYPYYDLNIFNIFTNLPQSIYFMKQIMQYFHEILPFESFDKINYYLFPLYKCNHINKKSLLDNIPGNVHIMEDTTLFPINNNTNYIEQSNNMYINDPVQILMFNDILGKLSHDMIRYNPKKQSLEQCYIEKNGNIETKRYESQLDYWCELTLKQLYNNGYDNIRKNQMNGVYIPTQFIQLLEQLKFNAPDHRLFIIDSPKVVANPIIQRLKNIFKRGQNFKSNDTMEWANKANTNDPNISLDRMQSYISFNPDFQQLETILNRVEGNDTRHGFLQPCEIETLGNFCDKWVDGKIKKPSLSSNHEEEHSIPREVLDKLSLQLSIANKSSLNILHS
ncbi:similar to Saccharomyces cerevisiae YKL162C Putative protein of unknown function [Maudiozyma saulgeensis]|uniref:type II protein arginine methyltransferase n=1 Tax=Maudiozyma saulgeensis TaxID=1789683 RepID=A0A1X7R9G1_9SACH|nr:similar to Saccharomyces cerevisiae YKL162C Putative protein of unknown function [Kazachstania saulgeensis]